MRNAVQVSRCPAGEDSQSLSSFRGAGPIRLATLLGVAAVLLVESATSRAQLPAYSILNLGTLPGHESSQATAINERGEVAGISWRREGDERINHAFLWLPESNYGLAAGMHDLGSGLRAFDINDVGQVVGEMDVPPPAGEPGPFDDVTRAFTWRNGFLKDLGNVAEGTTIDVVSVNNSGEVFALALAEIADVADGVVTRLYGPKLEFVFIDADSGAYTIADTWDPEFRSLIVDRYATRGFDQFRIFGQPGSGWETDSVLGLNGRGSFVGWFRDTARVRRLVLWNGAYQVLPFTFAFGMNELDQVVGRGPSGEPVVWLPAPAYGLGNGLNALPGVENGTATAINNEGLIVGSSGVRLWVWKDGETRNVADLLPEDAGWDFINIVKDVNDAGQIVGSGVFDGQSVGFLLNPAGEEKVELSIDIPDEILRPDDLFPAKVVVSSTFQEARTITFFDPLLGEDPPEIPDIEDTSILTVSLVDLPPPFELTPENPTRTFEVPVSVRKSGVTHLVSSIQVSDASGETEDITTRKVVSISPFEITITTTPREVVLNQIPEGQQSMGCPPGADNCVEIKATIRNTTDQRIDNVNVPGATEVLSFITSRDPENPGVPLTPLLFVPPAGTPEAPEFVTLEPSGSITEEGTPTDTTEFIWYLDAYDAPADLNIKVLAVGSIDGANVKGLGQGRLKLIKDVLLKWGIKPRSGQTSYLAGQPARVDAFIENVSKENGEGRDLIVMVYQLPEGNLGGGFLQKASEIGHRTPQYYEIFQLPPEDDDPPTPDGRTRRLDLGGIFASLPLREASDGLVKYDVRVWVREDDGSLTNADSQALLADGWLDEFRVRFAAVEPPPDTYRDECLAAGIPAEICGISEGLYFVAAEDGFGLLQFAINGWNEAKVLAPEVVSYNLWVMKLAWDSLKNDPEARAALYQESYAYYVNLVNLGVMAGEAGSQVPMVFEAFVDQGVESFDSFIRNLTSGDLTNIRANVGKFLGSNPDLLLEPIAAGLTYSKLSRSLASASENLAGDVVKAHLRHERERRAISLEQRLAAAEADPNVTNLARVLKAGDELPDHLLRKIYGLDSNQRKALEKFCRENKVIVTFRSRHPNSAALLEAGTAYPKPKALKWKNVNDIDVKYLGYRRDALATVQIVEPPPGLIGKSGDELEAALDVYMQELRAANSEFDAEFDLNPVLAGEVRGRLRTQSKMWNKHAVELDLKDVPSRTEIGVNFGTNAQFTHDVADEVGVNDLRNVHLTPVEGAPDPVTGVSRRTWELKMDGPGGAEAKAVTGDIDFLAILDENGMFITDEAKRIQLYKQLAEMVDMQHGESFAFRLQDMRAEFLRCCVEGEEAMVTMGPWANSKPKAGHFVDNLSVMDSGANSAFRRPRQRTGLSGDPDVVLREGELLEVRHADPSGEFPLINGMPHLLNIGYAFSNRFYPQIYERLIEDFVRRFRRFYFPAILARLLFRDSGDQNVVVEPEFSASGPVIRAVPANPDQPNGARNYQVWTEAGGWRTISVSEAIELTGGNLNQIQGNASSGTLSAAGTPTPRFQVAPMTTIIEPTMAGDYTLLITGFSELGAGGTFFESGDRIVINPGEVTEEFAVIVTVEPFMVANALTFPHESGEMVALANKDPAFPRLTVSSVGDGAILLSWESENGTLRLETADNLSAPIEWIEVTETPIMDGTQARLEMQATDHVRFFRLVSQ